MCNFPRHASFRVTYLTPVQYHCKAKLFIGICERKKGGAMEGKVPL